MPFDLNKPMNCAAAGTLFYHLARALLGSPERVNIDALVARAV